MLTVTGEDVALPSPAVTFTVTDSEPEPPAVGTLKDAEVPPGAGLPLIIH